MELWFVLINQEEVGPLELESVVKGIEAGKVVASTPVRSASNAAWEDAARIPQLARFFVEVERLAPFGPHQAYGPFVGRNVARHWDAGPVGEKIAVEIFE